METSREWGKGPPAGDRVEAGTQRHRGQGLVESSLVGGQGKAQSLGNSPSGATGTEPVCAGGKRSQASCHPWTGLRRT